MESTSGLFCKFKNCFTYVDKLSIYRLCPSVYIVSKASDDLPEPDKPVMTTNLFLGILILIFFKLFCLAPVTSMKLNLFSSNIIFL